MIRNIIFDVGKVLVSYEPECYMKSLGLDGRARAAINSAMFDNYLWNQSDQGLGTPQEFLQKFIAGAPEYEAQIRNIYETVGGTIELLPYVMDWMEELKAKGYRLYILSNYSENMLEQTREKLKFLSVVDGAVFSYACKMIKPDPGIYRYLMDEYMLKPSESVFLDDRPENIEAAEKLGIHGILFQNYEQAKAELNRICSRTLQIF